MKLLLDQGLSRTAAVYLREQGHDVVHTSEVALTSATDVSILEVARSEDRVIVTLDADFHMLLAMTKAQHPSVIRIREEGLKAKEVAERIVAVLSRCGDELVAGALISVVSPYIRVKLLPIV